MPSYLITGASRGLGLGFTTELLKDKKNIVVATARSTAGSPGLQELKAKDENGRLVLIDLDVSKPESIRAAAEKTAQALPNGLDNLISNAGVSYNALKPFEELDVEEFTSELNFTVTAPLLVVREFLPLIRKSEAKRVLVVSSALGSLQNAAYLPNLANGYSVARAALNMLARKWSPILKNDQVTMAIIHPGWVSVTEIGDGITEWIKKYNPDLENLTIEQAAANCMKVLNGLTLEDSGAFINYDGTKVPF
ncbi:putative short-chain dehydrogenase [Thelonectria olida]|uniref:Short-chain dehydrogenase n=1 Tax=Thelonectria olida TaxID=1576542 RepID=A0A9P8W306_9HYPO|nr:putative short-chain dehydrogenase [Thelonectria olida]